MFVQALKTPKSIVLAAMVALGSYSTVGCAADTSVEQEENAGASTDDITGNMNQTIVKRQSIGNCWLYAMASWQEALYKRATGKTLNASESYSTYWHWFEQIANSGASEISTGGSFDVATRLYSRYGIMTESRFISAEGTSEMSATQKTALAIVNDALKNGELKDPAARRDRAKVRSVLDKAWKLSVTRIAGLDAVFGKGVTKTLDRSYIAVAPGNSIMRAQDIPVAFPDGSGKIVQATLADAAGLSTNGRLAFQMAWYPSSESGRRSFQQRVQRAMHDGAPVVVSWQVDFNALTRDSQFSKAELDKRGPGRQGGHMVVMHDYQAKLESGRVLKAGEPASAADLAEALKPSTKIEFIRVKNSWGVDRADRWDTAAIGGYHDLDINYLNGPIKKCEEKNGETDTTNCKTTITPLQYVYLPAGY
jgi:hypothetical protein